jgi:hypothetical protein
MLGKGLVSLVTQRMMGPLSREPASFGSVPRAIERKNEGMAAMLGMSDVPDPNDPNFAQSMGRAAGGSVYGPLRAPVVAGNVAAEGTDYAIQKSGGGMLARFLGSLVGGFGAEQVAGNSAAIRGAASGAGIRRGMNRVGLKAWNRLQTLDIVEDSFAEALTLSKDRASRMLTFGQGSWEKFDQAMRRGVDAKGTEFIPGGNPTVDPSALYAEANYIWTTTPVALRKELPGIFKILVDRSNESGKGVTGRMRLSELRGYHLKINELWKEAAHRRANPRAEARASKADALRGPIEMAYAQLLTPSHSPSVPNPQRGPTLPQGKGVVEAPMTRGTMELPAGRGQGQSYEPSQLNREQAGALATALESSRQLGSELDNLKRAGVDIASGKGLEPVKVINAILKPGAKQNSVELAEDMLTMLTREEPVRGKQALGQSWQDYVFGVQGEFTQREALGRLNSSRAVGGIWAGKDKVDATEAFIKSMGDRTAKDHSFANLVGSVLGIASGAVASGGAFPSTFGKTLMIASTAGATAAAPRLFNHLRERYGEQGVQTLMREMVFDRAKYFKLKKIAEGTPNAKDFEWVTMELRGALLKASGRAARQSQGETQ